jgi:hypothetical protein
MKALVTATIGQPEPSEKQSTGGVEHSSDE